MEFCHACDERDDHYHQYVNIRGNTVYCWLIDGLCFTAISSAAAHISSVLDCSLREAADYARSLPKRYG